MKIKIKFTDEHIALIKAMNFGKISLEDTMKNFEQMNTRVAIIHDPAKFCDDVEYISDMVEYSKVSPERVLKLMRHCDVCILDEVMDKYHLNIDHLYGVDNYNLWGGTYLFEQMAYILGYQDKIITGTLENPTGPEFETECYEHMKDLDAFIVTNLGNIFEILLQFCTEGIQEGVTYWCYDNEHIWHKGE